MAKNIIFPGLEIVWRVHWKLVQLGAFPAVRLNTYPSFGDGEQLCLLKCKFPLGVAVAGAAVAAAVAAVVAMRAQTGMQREERRRKAGGGERCIVRAIGRICLSP